MKKLLITSALATALASGSVLANPAAQQGDLDQIFAASGKAGQVAALSHQEMKETEGGVLLVLCSGHCFGTYSSILGAGISFGASRFPKYWFNYRQSAQPPLNGKSFFTDFMLAGYSPR